MTSNFISVETIMEKIAPIFEKYPINKAILFGSYAKGDATINSDVDLYIDTNGKLRGLDFVGLLEILVNTLEMDIDLIDKSHIEQDSLIMQEIENGGMVIYEKSKDYSKDN
ncbi:nucleotidyltransferase family protein [Tissierella carlieri]|jgi:predicted nucleotidyltransferase|uniref:nucleotidyltransferase family protein n=1 Tax=Tissierella carlieri TaxID=689904 RepID=UPI00280409C9|nr:nucleotidyltransferase domain-containing protein [uncultured Tissierella sp.]MDU5083274.1 nucleotidyltransferase domain-containing protein [Bacillota bacterium]